MHNNPILHEQRPTYFIRRGAVTLPFSRMSTCASKMDKGTLIYTLYLPALTSILLYYYSLKKKSIEIAQSLQLSEASDN